MTAFLRVAGIGVLCALLCSILQESGGKYARAVCLGGCLLLFGAFLARFSPMLEVLKTLTERTGMGEWGALLLKALGIAYLTSLSAGVCRDLGTESVAKNVELCGRAELLLLALPLIRELLALAFSLAEGG